MNFFKKEFPVWCLGLLLMTGLILIMMALGMNYLSAQTAGGPQPVVTVNSVTTPGDQAKPLRTPHHQHKKPMLGQKIPGEGTQPGYSANVDPTPNTH